MRTLTAAQQRVLESTNRATNFRVKVDAGSGFVDLTDLEDRDWVVSADYGGGTDMPIVTADVKIRRQAEELNLATLVDSSKLNAGGTQLDIANPIVIEVAVIAQDAIPADADWVEVFRGEIDEIDWGSDPLAVKARDQGGLLVDTFIETQRAYGSQGGVDLETVIQGILDDNINNTTPALGNVDLYSLNGTGGTPFNPADSPLFKILPYKQSKESVFEAIRRLAQMVGADVKYKWHDNTSAFQLVFFLPERKIPARGKLTFTGQPSDTEFFTLNATAITAKTVPAGSDDFQIDGGGNVSNTVDNAVTAVNIGSETTNALAFSEHIKSRGTLTLTGTMSDGDTFDIDTVTYTARNTPVSSTDFQIGLSTPVTADNIVALFKNMNTPGFPNINAIRSQSASAVFFEWRTAGVAGNAIVFTESSADATVDGAGTLGGTQTGEDNVIVEWKTPGAPGNSIVFTEGFATAATADGAGTLGGTQLGDAGKIIPDFTFDSDHYFDVSKLRLSRQDIRNVVQITFFDPDNENIRFTVVRQDDPSISKFGRRYMEITEATNSQIDTISEAADFANFALRDLSEPDAEQSISAPYFWPIEDADLQRFEANGAHYDTDQDLAVKSFRHSLSLNSSKTTTDTRGKPAGGIQRWLIVEGRPGVAPAQDLFLDASPTGVVTTGNVGQIIIRYDDPRESIPGISDWSTTAVHAVPASDPGFPDFTPSVSNKVADGRQLEFVIGDLNPGVFYAVKLIIFDGLGNESSVSVVVQQATERVGPFHENTDGQQDQLLRNNDFNIFTKGVGLMPDFWNDQVGAFLTDILLISDSITGASALQLAVTGSTDPAIRSDAIPFTEGDIIVAGAFMKGDVADASTQVDFNVVWLDSTKTPIGVPDTTSVTVSNGVYQERSSAIFHAPATTRFVSLEIEGVHIGTDFNLDIDRVGLMRASVQARSHLLGTPGPTTILFGAANTPVTILYDDIKPEQIGISYAAGTGIFTVDLPGSYVWTVQAFSNLFSQAAHDLQIDIEISFAGAAFGVEATSRTPSTVRFGGHFGNVNLTSPVIELDQGDRVLISAQSSVVTTPGSDGVQGSNNYVSAKMLERNTK